MNRRKAYGKKNSKMKGRQGEHATEQEVNRSDFSYELTLLNNMAETESQREGRAKGWLRPNTLLIILLATR